MTLTETIFVDRQPVGMVRQDFYSGQFCSFIPPERRMPAGVKQRAFRSLDREIINQPPQVHFENGMPRTLPFDEMPFESGGMIYHPTGLEFVGHKDQDKIKLENEWAELGRKVKPRVKGVEVTAIKPVAIADTWMGVSDLIDYQRVKTRAYYRHQTVAS